MKLEVKKIGNSTGLILPKELLARLELRAGRLGLRQRNGRRQPVSSGATDPVFEKAMEIAEKAMKTYRNALEELAK